MKNAVATGKFAHAYLFYGPRGTGKTSAARLLAKAINCEHTKDGNPDNTCDKCKLIDSGKAIDILEIDAASHTQVDNIREVIIERAKFAPTNLKYKVYIIDEAHMLSKSSFNALLKTLEEPPAHTVFILATTEIQKIIPTIQSRCQRFDFHRITDKVIVDRLKHIAKEEKIKVDDAALAMIAKTSEGGFRDAISILDQAASDNKGEIKAESIETLLGIADLQLVYDYVYAVVSKDSAAALRLLADALTKGYQPSQLFRDIVEILRNLLVAATVTTAELGLSESAEKQYQDILGKVTTSELINLIDNYIRNEDLYKHSGLYQLALEVATIKACTDYVQPATSVVNQTAKSSNRSSIAGKTEVAPKPIPADARGKWQHFLLEVKSKNNSIHAVLKVCEPSFDGNEVCLAFPYKFHKERIEDIKNRQVVEETLSKVYGEKYKIKCTLRPTITASSPAAKAEVSDDLLDDAINIFGGEVVG